MRNTQMDSSFYITPGSSWHFKISLKGDWKNASRHHMMEIWACLAECKFTEGDCLTDGPRDLPMSVDIRPRGSQWCLFCAVETSSPKGDSIVGAICSVHIGVHYTPEQDWLNGWWGIATVLCAERTPDHVWQMTYECVCEWLNQSHGASTCVRASMCMCTCVYKWFRKQLFVCSSPKYICSMFDKCNSLWRGWFFCPDCSVHTCNGVSLCTVQAWKQNANIRGYATWIPWFIPSVTEIGKVLARCVQNLRPQAANEPAPLRLVERCSTKSSYRMITSGRARVLFTSQWLSTVNKARQTAKFRRFSDKTPANRTYCEMRTLDFLFSKTHVYGTALTANGNGCWTVN